MKSCLTMEHRDMNHKCFENWFVIFARKIRSIHRGSIILFFLLGALASCTNEYGKLNQREFHFSMFIYQSEINYSHSKSAGIAEKYLDILKQLPYFKVCGSLKKIYGDQQYFDDVEVIFIEMLRKTINDLSHLKNEEFLFVGLEAPTYKTRLRSLRGPYYNRPKLFIDRSDSPFFAVSNLNEWKIVLSITAIERLCGKGRRDHIRKTLSDWDEKFTQRFPNATLSKYYDDKISRVEGSAEERAEENAMVLTFFNISREGFTQNLKFETAFMWLFGHEIYHFLNPTPVEADNPLYKIYEDKADRFGVLLLSEAIRRRSKAWLKLESYMERHGSPENPILVINFDKLFKDKCGECFQAYMILGYDVGNTAVMDIIIKEDLGNNTYYATPESRRALFENLTPIIAESYLNEADWERILKIEAWLGGLSDKP